ncbi:MAG TPA: hypothetical protein VGD83_30770 [Streptosporangiaceae bacterium]
MLISVAVVALGHDYNGPGASAITLSIIALIVLILVGECGRKTGDYRPAAGRHETGNSLG